MSFCRILIAALCVLGTVQAQDKPLGRQLKLRIAVAPIEWNGFEVFDNYTVPVEFRNAINEKLIKRLFDTGRFIVLEREAIEAMLSEKAVKEENTGESQRGKIIPAQALVRGKLTDFTMRSGGTGAGIGLPGIGTIGGSTKRAQVGLNVRIFNVDTSELIATETSNGTASANGFTISGGVGSLFGSISTFNNSPLGLATTKAIDGAVLKIVEKLGKQPWQGRVADFDEDEKLVTLNSGGEAGLRVGDVFDVVRPGKVIKDPETGAVLSVRTTKVGKVKVTEVEPKFAVAVVVDGEAPRSGDIVREIR